MKPIIACTVLLSLFVTSCTRDEGRFSKPAQQTQIQKTASESGEDLVKDARKSLDLAKERLIQEEKYSCCIDVPCDMCALEEASCTCYDDLRKGNHVCIECYAGWQQGKGVDRKIRKEQVKTDFVQHSHSH